MFIKIEGIEKSYGNIENKVNVIDGVTTDINKGELCVILGPSGSGKSTLLNLIGGLDILDKGHIIVDGLDISILNSKKIELYRRNYLGFIFQFYNLVPNLTVRENIEVCEYLTDTPLNINELLDILGMSTHQNKFPSQLSGGQQQRCSIARALVKNPKLLLCDEPTGALDYHTSKDILSLLENINNKYGTTIIIVTHNKAIKDMVNKVIKIKDGKIIEDYRNNTVIPASDLEW